MDYKLEQVYRQIPQSTCVAGCGECCGMLHPSLAEIRNVEAWLEARGREFIEFHMLEGMDCPYLGKDKSCTIYPVRPFLCRILGVAAALPCPLKKCTPTSVLNHPQSSHLYTEIYLRGKEKSRTERHRKVLYPILHKAGMI